MSVTLEMILNQEEWLELALSTLDEYPKQKTAWGILRWYVTSENGELEENEFLRQARLLHAAWKMRRMIEAGLVEFDFERQVYLRTSEGEEIGEALRRSHSTT
ncbi:MAG: hypothetical protein SGI77_12815 [Pirellulaceae bacterium]|nr:hypothetical protein [Pirellulaceae bacterium]